MHRIQLITLFILISLAATAQKDYAVSMTGDTIFGKLNIYQSGPTAHSLVIKSNKKNKELSPYEYMEVTKPGKYTYKSVVVNRIRYFMRVVVEGYLSLYDFNYSEMNSTSVIYEQVIHERGSLAEIVRNIGYKKHLESYLKQCQELVTTMANTKKYKKSALPEFVRNYNECVKKEALSAPSTAPVSAPISQKQVSALSMVDEALDKIQKQPDFEKKDALLEIMDDVKSRLNKGEKIPDYLWPIMTEYAASNNVVAESVKNLREDIDKLINQK